LDSKGTDIALEISDGFVGVKLFLRAGGWRSAGRGGGFEGWFGFGGVGVVLVFGWIRFLGV